MFLGSFRGLRHRGTYEWRWREPAGEESSRAVLFAWELGRGMGHICRLVPIARELAARGYRVVFALRQTEADSRCGHWALLPRGFLAVAQRRPEFSPPHSGIPPGRFGTRVPN
jgi:hypothetical protein